MTRTNKIEPRIITNIKTNILEMIQEDGIALIYLLPIICDPRDYTGKYEESQKKKFMNFFLSM